MKYKLENIPTIFNSIQNIIDYVLENGIDPSINVYRCDSDGQNLFYYCQAEELLIY